ncbi:MAG: hypothetical protein FJX55_20865 [Alphaproteobacteria bacterium]|nr:hypothetical protein [Alphaproteobacteria bacterium]
MRCGAWLLPVFFLLAACAAEKEPDDGALREAVERMHNEWVAERRKDQKAQVPDLYRRLPNVNLAFEANLALRITSVRKVSCKRTGDTRLGHVCRVVVGASLAGRAPVTQNLEGRFVRGLNGWHVRDLVVLEAPAASSAN